MTRRALFAAAALGLIFVVTVYRQGAGPLRWPRVWLFLFLAGASHGVLDALTNGGLGVAFFAPFANERHFFPFRPIEVSPLSIRRFLSPAGLAILWNEFTPGMSGTTSVVPDGNNINGLGWSVPLQFHLDPSVPADAAGPYIAIPGDLTINIDDIAFVP